MGPRIYSDRYDELRPRPELAGVFTIARSEVVAGYKAVNSVEGVPVRDSYCGRREVPSCSVAHCKTVYACSQERAKRAVLSGPQDVFMTRYIVARQLRTLLKEIRHKPGRGAMTSS